MSKPLTYLSKKQFYIAKRDFTGRDDDLYIRTTIWPPVVFGIKLHTLTQETE